MPFSLNDTQNEVAAAFTCHDLDDVIKNTSDAEKQKFLNLQRTDLDGLVNMFDSYATKKTYAAGFFNLALIATNFTQLKQLIELVTVGADSLSVINIVVLMFVSMSLLLQFVIGVALVCLARNNEFIDEDKREQLIRNNNFVTLLVGAVSVINVFINVFLNV